ncbi:MAG TPA: YjgP/YjgQ family permease [Candidatus Marinimicrobia bacterium]|nr:YjgP/YjgQ family permease [Candidatus Neomarinimicrobiota bacterium]HIA86634.1 YjgP/YjgQ family permease [Candidatus Neomarinimicrobiota bacterium]HIB57758.1 YjgP/YjgQ family permease [Candidatus Neomarinimicrobiota bacterium]HIN46076.1 YjgP/YjgQ family permease [Candidatus Neomarinimicrobiota bacterium]
MIKRIDAYLIQRFIQTLAFALIAFVGIFLVVDLVENMDKFIDSEVPREIILQYYLHSLPWFLNIGLPMAVLVAAIFTIGILSKRNELTAMKSSGISLYRISIPLLLCAVLVSAGSFYWEDNLVTSGNQARRAIEKEYLGKTRNKHYRERRNNIILQKSNFVIGIERYQSSRKRAYGVTMQFLTEGKLQKRIDANRMYWQKENGSWQIMNYAIRSFNSDGEETEVSHSTGDTTLVIGFEPSDISREAISPEEMSFSELQLFVNELAISGVDNRRWEVNLHGKISFAFTNLIIVLFAVPMVASRPQGGLAFGAGMSIFVIFGYYAFIRFGQTLGYNGVMDPVLSAWLGNIVFAIGGILLLFFVRK